MTSLKVWTRTLRLWARSQRRHLLYKRWVRQVLYFLQNFSLPGGRGVPLYDIIGYFIAGSFGSSIAQRAKGLAFSFLSALPPLMIFVFSLIAYLPFDGLQDEFMTELSEVVPGNIMTPLSDTVNDIMGHKHTTLLSIGFITSIILAANGMNGFILSLNFANQTVEKRPFFQRFLLCIMMVFVLYVIIVLVLGLLIGHKYILQIIFSQGWLTDTKANTLMFNIGRWVLLSIAMLMALAIIYYFAPASRQRVGRFSAGHRHVLRPLVGLRYLHQQLQPLQPPLRLHRYPIAFDAVDLLQLHRHLGRLRAQYQHLQRHPPTKEPLRTSRATSKDTNFQQ